MAIVLGNMTFTGGFQFTNSGSTPPGPTPPSDPEFEYTTLLLDGLGTNGAQNNTFLDSSTNSFTITRNGNTTQGSFTPFSHSNGYWSNYFDGNGDYLSLGNSSNLTVSGDFTFEFWFMIIGTVGSGEIDFFESQTTNTFRVLKRGSSSGLTWDWYGQSEGALIKADADIVPNVWHHVAVSRISGTVRSYYDGTRVNTTSNSRNGVAPSAVYTVGGRNGGTNPLNGYVSNMRLVVGTGLYTGDTIQVPTTPLTTTSQGASETQVELLTCQSSRFMDNSTNNLAITSFGNTAASLYQPFALSSEYNSNTMGGSMYFDGTGDYLTAPSNAAFDFGSGSFTIEGWVLTTSTTASTIYHRGGTGSVEIFFTGSILQFWGDNGVLVSSNDIIVNNGAWHHFAVVRNGNNTTLYIDGIAGTTDTTLYTYPVGDGSVWIGNSSTFPGTRDFEGYISNFRIVKGTAVYTANFTPPTSPVTAISGTSLLLNGTNAGVFDSTGFNNAETVGNARISTAQSKWGGSSMYFDGSGDYLITPGNPALNIGGSSTWTIEFWGYIGAAFGTYCPMSMVQTSNIRWGIEMGASTTNVLFSNSLLTSFTNPVTLQPNTWYHFALTRDGTTTRWFVNGQPSVTTTTNNLSSVTATTPMHIGRNNVSGFFFDWNGYMQGVRITNGVARYTGTFTPPTDY